MVLVSLAGDHSPGSDWLPATPPCPKFVTHWQWPTEPIATHRGERAPHSPSNHQIVRPKPKYVRKPARAGDFRSSDPP